MLSSKRHVLTIAAVIATATMAAGLGTLSLAGGHTSPPAATVAAKSVHTQPAHTGLSWTDDQEGGD
jgi:hypothetical protein